MKRRGSLTEIWLRVALPACLLGGPAASAEAPASRAKKDVTISLIATNDVHGRLSQLPLFGGYLKNVRTARAADGGGVLLLDAGDIFQGTLASNLTEGAAMLRGYSALGYAAAALGNHEFDFGPVGPECTPDSADDNPLGALCARIAEASFPLLCSNLRTREGQPAAGVLPGLRPSIMQVVAGVRIGVVGGITVDALSATHGANVAGLSIAPLAQNVAREAAGLRAQGAEIVVALVHAGSECGHTQNPDDASSCDQQSEAFKLARALAAPVTPAAGAAKQPAKPLVDVIVGGHTHAYVAHRVSGIPIIESGSNGQAFGRIDFTLPGGDLTRLETKIFEPQPLCPDALDQPVCAKEPYAGAKVDRDPRVLAAISDDLDRARRAAEEPLGVRVTSPVTRSSAVESPLSNLVVDLMRKAVPGAHAAINNPGSVRIPLPVGPLTYGRVFEMVPFENRLASLRMRVADLVRVVQNSLQSDRGLVALSGVRATARCKGDVLSVNLMDLDGVSLPLGRVLTVVTSDYVAASGDNLLDGVHLAPSAIKVHDTLSMRDALITGLKAFRGGTIDGADRRLYDAKHPRLRYPGPRPIRCSARPPISESSAPGPT